MTDFQALLQRGDAWMYLPSALLLGALHGLEPGHSKSLMASFIVAVRGTVGQAVLLGLAATVSHTAVVWVIALLGLYGSQRFATEEIEPVLQGLSAVLVFGLGLWMIRRTWLEGTGCGHGHDHGHGHGHGHAHGHPQGHGHEHTHRHDHGHDHAQGHAHAADHAHQASVTPQEAPRRVGTGEIVMFGLTGGLMPCPASVAVLLLCLQVGQVGLGAGLVLAFSVGLALTLMAAGVTAALGAKHLSERWSGLNALARRAPYLSGAWMVLLGLVLAYQALHGHGHG